jgi:MFS transporter, PAT family, beta-lactamase induction signal transducer AmpG
VRLASTSNLLASSRGRRFLFAALYLSEGAPVGFVWWAMPGLLRERGVDLASITTLTTFATLPWVFKFLVAPAIDSSLASRRASLKQWIIVCQLAMAVALLPLLFLDWRAAFGLVVAAVFAHALFAATQDVAIDTLAIRTVPEHELGRVNGAMQVGMLLGRAGVAAGAAIVAAVFGTPAAATLCVMALILGPALILLYGVVEPATQATPVRWRSVLSVFRGGPLLAGAAVALLAGAGFEFFGVSVGARIVDLGGSDSTRALFYGLLAPGGLAVGALVGGMLADRAGVLRATSLALGLMTLVLAVVATGDLLSWVLQGQLLAFAAAYFFIGVLTASSYALFMTLARGELAATRFSILMAMTNACEAWAGFVGGRFGAANYGVTLLALCVVACTAIIPLAYLAKSRHEEYRNGQRIPA